MTRVRQARHSKQDYRALFENMLDGLAYCKMVFEDKRPVDFVYLDVNKAFEKLTGLKDVIGRRVTEVIPGIRESNPKLFEVYGRVAATGSPETLEIYIDPLAKWFSVSVYSPEKGYFIATFDNITEHKHAESEARANARRNELLSRVSKAVSSSLDLATLAEKSLEATIEALNLDAAVMWRTTGQGEQLTLLALRGLPDDFANDLRTRSTLDPGQGLAGRAVKEDSLQETGSLPDDVKALFPSGSHLKYRYYVGLPLRARGSIVGAITGFAVEHVPFTREDRMMMENLASEVGMAIANANLFGQVVKAKQEWEKTFDSMVDGVALISPDQRIIRVNRSLARMAGTSIQDMVGRFCYEEIHGKSTPVHDCPTCQVRRDKKPCSTVFREPKLGNRWFHVTADPVIDSEGTLVAIVHTFRDITTERRQREHFEQLYRLSRVVSSSLELDKVLSSGVDEIRQAVAEQDATAGIALVDPWSRKLSIFVAKGPHGDAIRNTDLPLSLLDPEAVRTLMHDRRPWLQPDTSRSSQILKGIPGFLESRSLAVFPLVAGERTSGVLFIANRGTLPGEDDIAFLETCASGIAMAVENARLYGTTDKALRSRVTELEALSGVLSAASTGAITGPWLEGALKKAAQAVEADDALTLLLDEDGTPGVDTGDLASPATDFKKAFFEYLGEHEADQPGKPVLIEDTATLSSGTLKEVLERTGVRSLLAVPMSRSNVTSGYVVFTRTSEAKSFSPQGISLAQAIASHLAASLENLRLHQNTERERGTLEAVVSSMNEGLIIVDSAGILIHCNRSAENLLGLNCFEHLGHSAEQFLRLLSPRVMGPPNWRQVIRAYPRGRSAQSSSRLTLKMLDNREIETNLFPVQAGGNRLGYGVVLRDVTREREVDRMKDEFISMASHELRTPMTSILGFSELLLKKATGLPEKQRAWIETIYKESRRLSDIVEDMLDVSQIETGRLSLKIEPVFLQSLVQGLLDLLPGRPSHTVVSDIPDNIPPVLADNTKLHQVLSNLIDNARKYSPKSSRVDIKAEVDGRNVVISIKDRGIGMAEEDMPRLFSRLHRIQRPETVGIRGTGLGLYIVKSLVQMMGGRVWAESKIDQGSTFFVSLPGTGADAKRKDMANPRRRLNLNE